MELQSVVLFVIVIVLVIVLIRYVSEDASTLSGLTSAEQMQTVATSSLTSGTGGASSSNFTYSIWLYISDWNTRYGETKVVFSRASTPIVESSATGISPCPSVELTPMENNLAVRVAVYPGIDDATGTTSSSEASSDANYTIHTCTVSNIPIQAWVNVTVSVYGRTLDIYLDGKLVRTCIMPGVAKVDSNAPVYITPDGGFSGWTSNFQYWGNSIDPQTAWNIYKEGYGGSTLGFLGRYSLKVTLMDGETETSSLNV